ncbi:MAG: radical SAM protein [Bacillota bacterium]
MRNLHLSRFLRTRQKGDRVALFHALHPEPVYLSTSCWKEAENNLDLLAETVTADLTAKGLLVRPGEDEKVLTETKQLISEKHDRPIILYLMLAQHCTRACVYCPIPELERQFGQQLLSEEDALAAVGLWERHIATLPKVPEHYLIFYGGEPLLNRSLIPRVIAHVRDRQAEGALPETVRFLVPTNGDLVDTEFARFCSEHDITVAVGLDGRLPEEDSYRVGRKGENLHDQTVRAIELLRATGTTTHASVSITPKNVEMLSEISRFLTRLGVERFGFNLMKSSWLKEQFPGEALEPFYRKAARAILRNARENSDGATEYQWEKKFDAFQGQFFPVDCTCYGNQIVVQPNGTLSNCPFRHANLGHVRQVQTEFRIANATVVQNLRTRLLPHPDDPSWASALYGGGCAWGTNDLLHDEGALDLGAMILAEEALDEFLWRD